MTDKEMLDWVESNVFKISQDFNEEFAIEFYDSDGTHKVVRGFSLRDCIQKAQPKQVFGQEHYFNFDGVAMKAVSTDCDICTNCDFRYQDCDGVNQYLQGSVGRTCAEDDNNWHIMFVNKDEKDSYFED